MEKLINMTPHDVNIVNEKGEVINTYPASGQTIRVEADTKRVFGLVDGTPLSKTVFGDVDDLPGERKGIFYIVSQLVKNAVPKRNDLLVPTEVVRNEKGQIIGCKSLGI